MRASLLALLLGISLFAGTGCSEYHYFVVTATLDTSLYPNRSQIQRCAVTVRNAGGGIEDDQAFVDCDLTRPEGAKFEYSTKGSGSLEFTFSVYDNEATTPNCEIGNGKTTVEDKDTTNFGDLTVTSNNMPGCT